MCSRSFEFTVPALYDHKRADVFLKKECGVSAHCLHILKLTDGGITRGGELLRSLDIVCEGDIIRLTLPHEEDEIVPIPGNLDILYEDSYLLVVNKPQDMPVHPTKRHQLNTLANIVASHRAARGEHYVFRALNRLDKDTLGCVLIAKDMISYNRLKGKLSKTYYAVCHGRIIEGGTIDAPISLSESSKIVRCVSPDGQKAVTHYEPVLTGKDATLLKLWLETGRTHQIRCHMASIGHPLLGDDLYGGSIDKTPYQALCCAKVTFDHPITGEHIELDTGIPDQFYTFVKE